MKCRFVLELRMRNVLRPIDQLPHATKASLVPNGPQEQPVVAAQVAVQAEAGVEAGVEVKVKVEVEATDVFPSVQRPVQAYRLWRSSQPQTARLSMISSRSVH
jgi:hypothetical protein